MSLPAKERTADTEVSTSVGFVGAFVCSDITGCLMETKYFQGSEPESEAYACDLRFQKVLIERSESLPVDFVLKSEIIEDIREREH
jgi:hypothetical protein